MKLTAKSLHKVHAAYDRNGGGWRVDFPGATWRVESSQSTIISKAMALRLAVCWNVLEGIPTQSLLDGCVKDFYEAAAAMAHEIDAEDRQPPDMLHLYKLVSQLRAADKAHQLVAVDCKSCAVEP